MLLQIQEVKKSIHFMVIYVPQLFMQGTITYDNQIPQLAPSLLSGLKKTCLYLQFIFSSKIWQVRIQINEKLGLCADYTTIR